MKASEENEGFASVDDYRQKSDFPKALSTAIAQLDRLRKFPMRVVGQRPSNYKKTKIYDNFQKRIRKSYIDYAEKREGLRASFSDRVKDIDEQYDRGLISLPQYYAMVDQALKDCDKVESRIAVATNEANVKINKLSEDASSSAESYSKEDDRILMRRLFFAFMIAAPFLQIPVLEGMMDPITNLFDPSKTMGETVSDMIKDESLGEFGKFLDLIKIDDIVKWFFDDSPIISEVFNLTENVAESTLVSGTASILRDPFFLVAPYAIAGVSTAYLVDQETRLYKSKTEKIKAVKEEIDRVSKDLAEDLDKVSKESAKESAKDIIKSLKRADYTEEIFHRLRSAKLQPDVESAEFKELFKDLESVKNLKKSDLLEDDSSNYEKKEQVFAKLFSLNDDQLKSVFERLAYCDSKKLEKVFDDLKSRYDQNLLPSTPLLDHFFDFSDPDQKKEKLLEFNKRYNEDQIFQWDVEESMNGRQITLKAQDYTPAEIAKSKEINEYYHQAYQNEVSGRVADKVLDFIDNEIRNCESFDRDSDDRNPKIHQDTTAKTRITELESQRESITSALDSGNQENVNRALEEWAEKQITQNLFRTKIDKKTLPNEKEIGYGKEPINFGNVKTPEALARARARERVSFADKVKSTNANEKPDLSQLLRGMGG